MRRSLEVVLFFCLTTVWLNVDSMTLSQSLRSLLNIFNETRNVAVDPAAKQKVRDFVVKTFSDHGLRTWTEEFPSNNAQYPGMNIVGQLSGRYTGSRDDRIVLIGSHYDSEDTTPGVDDNGSGMTALLQAVKLYTSSELGLEQAETDTTEKYGLKVTIFWWPNQSSSDKLNCSQDYTILFVAFDLEEVQPPCPLANCSCQRFICGSDYFVQNLTRYLNNTGIKFQGAVVLDTILNHNTTPNSQKLPSAIQQVFPTLYQRVSEDQFKGDFLAVIGRLHDDITLIDALTNAFRSDATFKSLAVEIPLALKGRPSLWPSQYYQGLSDFFRSDHYRFWNAEPSLPAVFITDTADFRGFMRQCYHQSCDDMSQVTPEMITFLARTTDSIVKVASNMTNEKCEMKKTDCGQNVMADIGEITTPYYNTQYPNKLDCAWTISIDAERKDLRLKFTAFDLEESENCTADYVEIRNGKDKGAPLIAKYCGNTLPEPIKASTQSLYIMFHSDELGAFKGFKAEWSSAPVTKSDAKGYYRGWWQLIGFLVVTSLVFVQ